ncbi:MAG: 3-keto-5-aminohexanoate cleavage protein [Burkholderiaceae bacterium]
MEFMHDSLRPENQEKLVIQAAPFGPTWLPGDTDDLPITMDQQVQRAVDCWNAGATVLHVHVREEDGTGSKRLPRFNEMLQRLREAVPKMILQVGGSISFAPVEEGDPAKWLNFDTRHLLAELKPTPDQVTIMINTSQLNMTEQMAADEIAGTCLENPSYYNSYRDMIADAPPSWVEEHLRRLVANGIQPHFMLLHVHQLETLEMMIRRGAYTGPLVLNYVAMGGGAAAHHPADLIEFIRRCPDGAVVTIESTMRSALPMCTIAIALGQHVRVGLEDNMWGRKGERLSSVGQIEQMVRISRELGREVASGEDARRIYQIGTHWSSADETLAKLGMRPNRKEGQRGTPLRKAA